MQGKNTSFPKGQALVEYALLILLIALVAGLALNAMGVSIPEIYNQAMAGGRGDDLACNPLARAGKDWEAFEDKFWRGGIVQQHSGYQVCPLCGGLLPGYSGRDYRVDLSGVKVKNVNPTWNGYGVTFRAKYDKKGLHGYMFEIEKVNKNAPVQIYFSKWVNGKQIRPPLAVQNLPPDFDWNNPPDISVKVEGDTFVAYLNGKEVLKASDKTYAEGGAGMVANLGTRLDFADFLLNPPVCEEAK